MECLLDGEVDLLVNLVPPQEIAEGETLQLDRQNLGQPPQRHLLGGLLVLLAPEKKYREREREETARITTIATRVRSKKDYDDLLRAIPSLFRTEDLGAHKLLQAVVERELERVSRLAVVVQTRHSSVRIRPFVGDDAIVGRSLVVAPVEGEEDGRVVAISCQVEQLVP